MNKPGRIYAKPLVDIVGRTINDLFARQGFAARELVTRWREIAGDEVATHSQPVKIQWPRPVGDAPPEPATLVLRVEGPMALEIQHSSDVIIERVNRFLGWQAIGRLSLRQAPLTRAKARPVRGTLDPTEVARVSGSLGAVNDDGLRDALAKLGAAVRVPIKRK